MQRGKYNRLPELAAELVRLEVDIIVTGGPLPKLCRQESDYGNPNRHGSSGRPCWHGLVDSLARPGGNVTGLTNTFA